MTLDQIQPYLASCITADVVLAPLGTPIQVDPFLDPEVAKAAIAAQLRATGVCSEVGFPWVAAPETLLSGYTHGEAVCELFVAEHTQVAHTPEKIALLTRFITACTRPPGLGQKPARLRACESVKTEGGVILHMLSLFIPLTIKQP